MFTTIEGVKNATGFDVPQETVIMAQTVIESYIGRVEAEVSNANDRALLNRATAYQAAYMTDDNGRTFTQMSATQIMEFGNMVSFADDGVSPWIAPLAVLACKGLSWNRIRAVKTGSIYHRPVDGVGSGWDRE